MVVVWRDGEGAREGVSGMVVVWMDGEGARVESIGYCCITGVVVEVQGSIGNFCGTGVVVEVQDNE